jgi:hypothetical protein
MLIAGPGTLVVFVATLTYRSIEYPWMAKPSRKTLRVGKIKQLRGEHTAWRKD